MQVNAIFLWTQTFVTFLALRLKFLSQTCWSFKQPHIASLAQPTLENPKIFHFPHMLNRLFAYLADPQDTRQLRFFQSTPTIQQRNFVDEVGEAICQSHKT